MITYFQECKDEADSKTCKKHSKNGNCDKAWVIKQCAKTCDQCPEDEDGGGNGNGNCNDVWKEKNCKKAKKKGKCKQKKVYEKCMLTCGKCDIKLGGDECGCNSKGSSSSTCDGEPCSESGGCDGGVVECTCKSGYSGENCFDCLKGYYTTGAPGWFCYGKYF